MFRQYCKADLDYCNPVLVNEYDLMKPTSRILKNTLLSFGTNVSAKLANVIGFIFISRAAGVANAGVFSLATIYLLILSSLLIGLDELITRQVARLPGQSRGYFLLFMTLRLVLSIGLYFCLIVLIFGLNYPQQISNVFILIGLCLIPDGISNTSQAVLSAFESYGVSFGAAIFSGVVRVVGIVWLLNNGKGILEVALVWLISSVIVAFIVLMAALRHKSQSGPIDDTAGSVHIQELWLSVPFILTSFFTTMEYQVDVILISKLLGNEMVGLYSSITTIIFSLALIPQAFRSAVYPYMIRKYEQAPLAILKIFQASSTILSVVAFPIIFGLSLLSERVIELVYGTSFLPAAPALGLIGFVLVFFFLNIPSSRILLIYNKQNLLPGLWAVCLGVNIGLNLLLLPSLGLIGAAIARIASESIFFFTAQIISTRLIGYKNGGRELLPAFLAALAMSAVVYPIRSQPIWLPVTAGIIIYPIFLLLALSFFDQERMVLAEIGGVIFRAILRQE